MHGEPKIHDSLYCSGLETKPQYPEACSVHYSFVCYLSEPTALLKFCVLDCLIQRWLQYLPVCYSRNPGHSWVGSNSTLSLGWACDFGLKWFLSFWEYLFGHGLSWGMQDLVAWPGSNSALCTGSEEVSHWTTREVLWPKWFLKLGPKRQSSFHLLLWDVCLWSFKIPGQNPSIMRLSCCGEAQATRGDWV